MEKANAASKHLAYLDGMRAFAAVYVVLHHALLQVRGENEFLHGIIWWLALPFWSGRSAVDVFIVLSGFCLMLPVIHDGGALRRGAGNFFLRRARRILPPYYCAMVFSLGLIALLVHQKTGTHWDLSLPVTGRSLITHVLLIQDAWKSDISNINHVFWSIAVEWRIYFLFPLFLWACRKWGMLWTVGVALAFSLALFFVLAPFIDKSLSAHYIGLFALGMFGATAAYAPERLPTALRTFPWGRMAAGLTLLLLLVTYGKGPHGFKAPWYVVDYVAGFWSTALLVMLSLEPDHLLRRLLGCRPVAFVGTFAYSIYLVHAPLLQVLWQYVFGALQHRQLPMFLALTLLGTPLIIAVSYLFFLVCEKPFLIKKTR